MGAVRARVLVRTIGHLVDGTEQVNDGKLRGAWQGPGDDDAAKPEGAAKVLAGIGRIEKDPKGGDRTPVLMELESWRFPCLYREPGERRFHRPRHLARRRGPTPRRHPINWDAYEQRHPWNGPGKTKADAGMGSCVNISEHEYELYSQSMGQSWSFTQWRRGGRSIYNEGSPFREPIDISDLEQWARDGDEEWWHPVSTDESTEFRFDGRRVSVDEASQVAETIRGSVSHTTMRVLDAYVEHRSVRKAAKRLGNIPRSTFFDALQRARDDAKANCPSPDTGS